MPIPTGIAARRGERCYTYDNDTFAFTRQRSLVRTQHRPLKKYPQTAGKEEPRFLGRRLPAATVLQRGLKRAIAVLPPGPSRPSPAHTGRDRREGRRKSVRNTHDYPHRHRGYWSDGGRCRIRIYRGDGQPPVVVCSQPPDNGNTSVTNVAEYLAGRPRRRSGCITASADARCVWSGPGPSRGPGAPGLWWARCSP